MKKLALALLMMIGLQITSFAGNGSGLFDIDVEQFKSEFVEFDEIESFVIENQGTTLAELIAVGANSGINIIPLNVSTNLELNEPPLGIPSFAWGCVLGCLGLGIVYFVAEDSEETKMALYGCLAWGAFWGILSIITSVR